eukprot:4707642-Pyramimonas_sp.AAC.1
MERDCDTALRRIGATLSNAAAASEDQLAQQLSNPDNLGGWQRLLSDVAWCTCLPQLDRRVRR